MKRDEFLASYEVLKGGFEEGLKLLIEIYHYNSNGEPFMFTEAYPTLTKLEVVDGELMILIHTDESCFTFNSKNYNTNLSNGAVVFSSKKDNKTVIFVSFV